MFQEFPEDNMNENYLSERRQKIADENLMNFEEHKNDMSRSRSVLIGAVSGLALAAVVGWFALSPRYSVDNVAEIPVIRRPQASIKVKPENPGGMEILNQDKTVYDIIEKEPERKEVESILPPPEQPILPEIKVAEQAPAPIKEQTPELKPIETTTEVKTSEVKTIAAPKAVVNETKEVTLPTIKEASVKENAQQKAETKPQTVSKVATAKPEPKTETSTASAGDWQVQLMSSPNQKAVTSAWSGLVKKHPALKGVSHEIETADLGSKGTYYRLKAGAFATRAEADKLCSAIKSQGGSCIVKKK